MVSVSVMRRAVKISIIGHKPGLCIGKLRPHFSAFGCQTIIEIIIGIGPFSPQLIECGQMVRGIRELGRRSIRHKHHLHFRAVKQRSIRGIRRYILCRLLLRHLQYIVGLLRVIVDTFAIAPTVGCEHQCHDEIFLAVGCRSVAFARTVLVTLP